MMRVRTLGVALVAVLAMSAVAAATASAHKFKASEASELTGKALNVHKFKTNGGTVECKKAEPKGKSVAGEVETQEVEVAYSECEFKSILGTKKAKVSPNPKYKFYANEEKVDVLNATTAPIVIEVEGSGCNVKVSSEGNGGLKKATYGNLSGGKTLEVKAAVTGITYKSTGGFCGEGGTNGTYEGNEEVSLVGGGTLEWTSP
jgi:hypothetical protein